MSNRSSVHFAEDVALLATAAGMLGGILAYLWFGVHAGAPSMVPHDAASSSLAPAMAVAETGVGLLGMLWNLAVFSIAGLGTACVVAVGAIVVERMRG